MATFTAIISTTTVNRATTTKKATAAATKTARGTMTTTATLETVTNRDEKRAWKKSPINGRRYRLKRNKQLKHPSIKFHNQWYNLGHILKGDSAISCEFRDSMKFLARNQIRFDSRNSFHDHIQAHNLNFIRSSSQFENVYNRCLIQTTQNIQFGDSLFKITKTFYKFLSNYSFRLPPGSRTVNLMTYAYYIKNSFKFIE